MAEAKIILGKLFAQVPPDLLDYFDQIKDGSFADRYKAAVHFLDAEDAVDETLEFRKFHPLVAMLGGVVLDDANSSDHHVYLSHPCCAGSVLYLAHDGATHVVFGSMREFLEAARKAIDSDTCLTKLHPSTGMLLPKQHEVAQLIADVYDGIVECDDSTNLIVVLLPAVQIEDSPLMRRIAQDRNFFLGEALALAIAARPRGALRSLAELLVRHSHFQVSAAGQRALTAITGESSQETEQPSAEELAFRGAAGEMLNSMLGGMPSLTERLFRQQFNNLGCPLGGRDGTPKRVLDNAAETLGVTIPAVLLDYYRLAGRESRFSDCANRFLLPHQWYLDDGRLVFIEEKAGATIWGVSLDEQHADPRVWQKANSPAAAWFRVNDSCLAFIAVMLHVQAVTGGFEFTLHEPYAEELGRRLKKLGWTRYGKLNRLVAYSRKNQVVCIEPELGVQAAAKTKKDLQAMKAALRA